MYCINKLKNIFITNYINFSTTSLLHITNKFSFSLVFDFIGKQQQQQQRSTDTTTTDFNNGKFLVYVVYGVCIFKSFIFIFIIIFE